MLDFISTKSGNKPLPFSADELNTYFLIITSNGTPVSDINILLYQSSDPELNRCYFKHITFDFLKSFFKSKSNSLGFNEISWKILELSLPVLLPHILNIFNRSLYTADFPDIWKRSIIVPLPKVNKSSVLSDFCPIALLPILFKVLERIVYGQITRNDCWLSTRQVSKKVTVHRPHY